MQSVTRNGRAQRLWIGGHFRTDSQSYSREHSHTLTRHTRFSGCRPKLVGVLEAALAPASDRAAGAPGADDRTASARTGHVCQSGP